jgi:hypothetical protein
LATWSFWQTGIVQLALHVIGCSTAHKRGHRCINYHALKAGNDASL